MCAKPDLSGICLEEFAGELAEAAYPVALKHGVKGSSIDVELDVWYALRNALRTRPTSRETPAELTQAAYQVALRRGFTGSFVDVELDLWKALSLAS
jgi:hypothetical protein